MMTNDLKSLVPAQEKLEWVTPKISLMDAVDTDGKSSFNIGEISIIYTGPS